MRIGSVSWRFFNYGPFAVLKYVSRYKHQLKPIRIESLMPTHNFESFAFALGASEAQIDECKSFIRSLVLEYESSATELESFSSMKVIHSNPERLPIRLLVISMMIMIRKPTIYIESGTQHGISALTACRALDKFSVSASGKVVTLDIKANVMPLISNEIDYLVLPSPVRFRWESLVRERVQSLSNAMFFHDSDHSYENMRFEIKTILDFPAFGTVISDDVDGNMAFVEIASAYSGKCYVVKEDNQPAIGILIND